MLSTEVKGLKCRGKVKITTRLDKITSRLDKITTRFNVFNPTKNQKRENMSLGLSLSRPKKQKIQKNLGIRNCKICRFHEFIVYLQRITQRNSL